MTRLEIQYYIEKQINTFFCYELDLSKYMIEALQRTENCLRQTTNKFLLEENNKIRISVYNSVHYCILLYHLSRVAYEFDKNGNNAEKLYYLNKIMNSVDVFYEVQFPKIWGVEHPLCSVMGKAAYSDYFFFYQGCTVGGNKGCYPTIGKCVTMYSNSKILGNAHIGDNVVISANTYIKDEDIPSNSVVFGQSPHLIIKRKDAESIRKIVSHIWKN